MYNEQIELVRAALNKTQNNFFKDEIKLIDDSKSLIKAAVLIAITNDEKPNIILTQRPKWLRAHAGQIAFPGGKMDADDIDIRHTALREAQEELAIEAKHVDIIATCPEYRTSSGYRITPIIGIIPHDINIKPNPNEVETWFNAPMSFLLNPENLQEKTAIWNGKQRRYYDMQWQNYRIWGITAGIIANVALAIKEYECKEHRYDS